MSDFTQYKGLSYEALSRRAAALIERAHKTGDWWKMVDDLVFIRSEMKIRLDQEVLVIDP